MKRILNCRPSPPMAVACVALFVALVGTGAASPIATTSANLGKSVKKALKLSKKADKNSRRALSLARKANKNSKVQAKGGATGPPGPAGSALAFARVDGSGALDVANSKNVASMFRPGPGVYCFQLNFTPKNVLVTVEGAPRTPGRHAEARLGGGTACSPETEATVSIYSYGIFSVTNAGYYLRESPSDSSFFVGFN